MSERGASAELQSILDALAHAPAWPIEEPIAIASGDRIGRYVLERVVGRGGFGVVFAAHDEELGRRVAIKVTRGTPTPAVLERFQHEGRIAARLSHPNLVTLHDWGTVHGLPFLVLELLDGETLAARRAKQPFALGEALAIVGDVLRALASMHAAGIVHLDLKPSNVALGADGRVKVLDFGLAQLRGGSDDRRRAGTPGYMAPEQLDGGATDERTDLYAAGVILHELTLGDARATPPGGATLAKLRAVCDRARAASPDARYPDATAMLAAVEAIAAPPRRSRWVLRAALFAAAVGLVAGIAWIVRERAASTERIALAERAGREAAAIYGAMHESRLAPLHDIRPDEALARERVAKLAASIEGPDDSDAAEVAVARAEMAVRDYARARTRLEAVLARGRSPAAAAVHGELLLHDYLEGMLAVRLGGPTHREADLARLATELRDPGLRELAEGGAATPLIEGLIALYQHRYADARRFAESVLAAEPSRFEAMGLVGDTYAFALQDATVAADPATARTMATAALAAYDRANALARSNDEGYDRSCAVHLFLGRDLDPRSDEAAREYAAGLQACTTALVARPDSARAISEAAVLRVDRSPAIAEHDVGAARRMLADARALIERGRQTQPYSFELAQALANVRTREAYFEADHDIDPRPALDAALHALWQAAWLDPRGNRAEMLGALFDQRARYEGAHGIDPEASVERAVAALRGQDARSSLGSLASSLLARAIWRGSHGGDPRASFEEALATLEQVRARWPRDATNLDEEGAAWQTRAEWEDANGADPRPSLDRAIECTTAALAVLPDDATFHNNLADELMVRANAEQVHGGNGEVLLRSAIEHATRSAALAPDTAAAFENLGVEHELAARWATNAGRDPAADLAAAHAALAKARSIDRDDAFILPVECDLEADLASWQSHHGISPAAAVARAKEDCDAALSIDPNNAPLKAKRAALDK